MKAALKINRFLIRCNYSKWGIKTKGNSKIHGDNPRNFQKKGF